MRAFALLLVLAGCTVQAPMPAAKPVPPRDLALVFDCLREKRLALVSAHRGQADPQAAENALLSFSETWKGGPIAMEMDVRRSADGVLVLMHDDTLDRTTAGTGPVSALTLKQLRQVALEDPAGRAIGETVPTLEEALVWGKRRGAILQLDVKRGVPFEEVIADVRNVGMASQVVIIVYNLADAKKVMALAPEMMLSASGRNADETAELLRIGRGNPRLLGFTGTSEPDAELIARMDASKVEAITGTLGAAGKRLDDRYMADGDGREYAELAARGTALIATDRPLDAWAALKQAKRDGSVCLTGEGA